MLGELGGGEGRGVSLGWLRGRVGMAAGSRRHEKRPIFVGSGVV